jgi:hypothetical protein
MEDSLEDPYDRVIAALNANDTEFATRLIAKLEPLLA